MPKCTQYRDIPQMTRSASYAVTIFWSHLERWLESQKEINIDIDPDFQRAHVWTEQKQARYVEYILRGGKSSKDLYFNCVGWMGNFEGPFVLVDGKQRMEAVRKFLRNELVIFDSCKYEDFTDKLPLEASFTVHVNDLKTREEVLRWYLDMNSGGVIHTEAELNKVRKLLHKELLSG